MADERRENQAAPVKKFRYEYHRYIRLDVWALIFILIVVIIARAVITKPFVDEKNNLICEYKSKTGQIICTQMGETVPEWLILDDVPYSSNYSMYLIFKKDAKNYKSFKMTDKVFIEGFNRKFIYAIDNQTIFDFKEFKEYAKDATVTSWGSVALYCSEEKFKEPVCKNMKKYHR